MAQKQWNQSKTPEMKPVFAAYLNLARHNAYRSLMHISKLMQIPESKEEAKMIEFGLWKKLTSGTGPEKVKIMKMLQRHFPLLKPIFDAEKKADNITVDANPNDVKRIFFLVLTILNRLRNEYSHFSPGPRKTGDEAKLITYLYGCLDGSSREVRNRFSQSINHNGSNKNTVADSRVKALNEAVEYIFQGEPFRKEKVQMLDKNGHPLKDKKGRVKMAFMDKPEFFYSLKKTDNTLSDIGIVFFICLFLEKRYAAMFLDAVKPWPKEFNEVERKAVLEVFSVFHINLPREKYDSTRPEYALGLDMLNELQKCPAELFDILPAWSRDYLSVDIQAQGDDVVQDDGVTVKGGKVQMKRVGDRFAPLAMQYIDKNKVFDKLRFMVHLGNYRFKFYMKQCIADEGPETLRILQKEINGYGRIDEIEAERKKQYSKYFKTSVVKKDDKGIEVKELVPDSMDTAPYMTDTKAHYLFDNNRIGLRFIDGGVFLPEITDKGYAKTSGKEIKLLSPEAWLSVYELPGLLFYQQLYKKYKGKEKGFDSPEEVVKAYITAYKNLFCAISEGLFDGWDEHAYAPLVLGDLPVKMRKFILEPERTFSVSFEEKSRKRIEKMYEWTLREQKGFETKLSKLSSKDNKFNKKHYVDLRPGAIAGRLVRDILYFTLPSVEKNKMTSANFNSLQSALALSGMKTEKVKSMLEGLRHPFVGEALSSYQKVDFCVYHFYKEYLKKRETYLKRLKSYNKDSLLELPFLHSTRIRWQDRNASYIKELAGRYEQFELPRGLFTAATKELLALEGIVFTEPEGERSLGMANLINRYFAEVLKDNNQSFYRWKRHYRVFDMLAGEKSGNQLVHKFLEPSLLTKKMRMRKTLVPSDYMLEKALASVNQTLEKSHKLNKYKGGLKDPRVLEKARQMLKSAYEEYDDNERILRRYSVQDKLLYLLSKDILLNIEGIDENAISSFKLKDIMPGKENTILELLVPFSIILEVDGVQVIIKQKDKIKIKRYGEFFRYSSDTRLKSLLPYLIQKDDEQMTVSVDLDRAALEEELSNYDLSRVKAMRMVQALEQSILSRTQETVPAEYRENFNTLVSKVGRIPYESQGRILISIRNSFCHNEYAHDVVLPENTPIPKIAETITHLFEVERKKKPTTITDNGN